MLGCPASARQCGKSRVKASASESGGSRETPHSRLTPLPHQRADLVCGTSWNVHRYGRIFSASSASFGFPSAFTRFSRDTPNQRTSGAITSTEE